MNATVDPAIQERISAYLDGALTEAERQELEAMVASDPAVAAEFEALSRVDVAVAAGFADMLAEPVPLHLARSIEAAQRDAAAAPVRAGNVTWLRSLAASIALVGIGAVGGAVLTRTFAMSVQTAGGAPGWLDQVTEYHAVYAAQGRHLVEVPASEKAHLEAWLSEQTGVPFAVPDLAASGLTFEGARLLVASGKPVAQLMYRDAAGAVIAVCFMQGGDATLAEDETVFADQSNGGFDLISWKDRTASYVVIGPSGREDLATIARAASIAL
jgi:anti-sigma factor RsiW